MSRRSASGAYRKLTKVQTGQMTLAEVHWKELEEIVCLLLRGLGLRATLNRRIPQGGRDIFVYVDLFPGEPPIQMAVEVKHKSKVNIDSLHQAMSQNRNYPLLLLATSGRFAKGVFKEQQRSENRFRVRLWDGKKLEQLIRNQPLVPFQERMHLS